MSAPQDTKVVRAIELATEVIGQVIPGVPGELVQQAGAKAVLAILELLGIETGRVDVVAQEGATITVVTKRRRTRSARPLKGEQW